MRCSVFSNFAFNSLFRKNLSRNNFSAIPAQFSFQFELTSTFDPNFLASLALFASRIAARLLISIVLEACRACSKDGKSKSSPGSITGQSNPGDKNAFSPSNESITSPAIDFRTVGAKVLLSGSCSDISWDLPYINLIFCLMISSLLAMRFSNINQKKKDKYI